MLIISLKAFSERSRYKYPYISEDNLESFWSFIEIYCQFP